MNALAGATATIAEGNYNQSPVAQAQIDDASYHYSMLLDACANAEQMIVQAVATANNHPWRHVLHKGQLLGVTGTGLTNGALIYAKPGTNVQVTDCISLGPVMDAASGGKILREAPLEDIQRRVTNPNTFFKRIVYFYRIQDDRIYHTVPTVFIDYYGYDKQTDTVAKYIANGSILFPHTAIPAYVAGALSMLLKEEEYAGQCQYYAAMFAGMLQQIVQGFTTVDPLGAPAPHKGTEST